MPVYDVTLIAPNGNRVRRPIVAHNAADAISVMEAEHGIDDAQAEGIRVEVTAAYDPDRRLERLLLGADARSEAKTA